MVEDLPKLILISGPTCSGKSVLAVAIAKLLGGQIINADSMQVYRGMDIGTAKLPISERKGILHHLIISLILIRNLMPHYLDPMPFQ